MTKPAPATRSAKAAPETTLETLPTVPLLSGVLLVAGADDDEEPEEDEEPLELGVFVRLLEAMVCPVSGTVLVTPVDVAAEMVWTMVDEPEVVVEINAPMANVPETAMTSLTFETSVATSW